MGDSCQRATRSANSDNSNNEFIVNPDGSRNNNNANNSNGVAPDCNKRQHRVNPYRGSKAVQPCKEESSILQEGENIRAAASGSGGMPFGFADLIKAVGECRKGVLWKDSVAGFSLNRIMNCHRLMEDLETGRYRLSQYTCFQIHEPKDRDIVATNIRDRVVQRALCDTYLYHAMTRGFIEDNMACQIGKGTTACRKRMKQYSQKAIRRYGRDCYVMKVDIKGYFASTRHEVAKAAVAKRVDNLWARQYVFNLIDSFHGITGDHCGIGLGSQISQLIELAVLDDIDHKAKRVTDLYIRYMDDMVAFGTKDQLQRLKSMIIRELGRLHLKTSPKKTFVAKFQALQFLGFSYQVHGSRIEMKPMKGKEYQERRKLRRQLDIMPVEKVDKAVVSWKANAKQGTDFNVIRRMNRFYAIERRTHGNKKKVA